MSSGNASNPQLDNESLAMLLAEVSAMAASNRSLVSGIADLDDVATGKLGRAAKQIQVQLDQGMSPGEAIASISSRYQAPIRIAMQTMSRTGSTEPIDEAVRLIREAGEYRYLAILAAAGPMLNAIVAATVLFFVMPWILVSISEAELIKPALAPSVVEICQTFAENFALAALGTVLVVGCFAAALYYSLLRSLHGNNAARDLAIFCRWLVLQVSGERLSHQSPNASTPGIDLATAIESAANVVGKPFSEAWTEVVQRVRGGSQNLSALLMPDSTPPPVQQCVIDLVLRRREVDAVVLDLQSLSELYHQQSRQRRSLWMELVPRWMTWLVMIAIIVLLLQTMIVPLMDAVGEVTR